VARTIPRTEVAAFPAWSRTLLRFHLVASDGRIACRSRNRMASPATCSAIERIPIDQAIRRTVEGFMGAMTASILLPGAAAGKGQPRYVWSPGGEQLHHDEGTLSEDEPKPVRVGSEQMVVRSSVPLAYHHVRLVDASGVGEQCGRWGAIHAERCRPSAGEQGEGPGLSHQENR